MLSVPLRSSSSFPSLHAHSPLKCTKSIKIDINKRQRVINIDVHSGNMEVRKAEDGIEYCRIDDGYEICCPVCGSMWLQEIEGDFDFGTCGHLRFILRSDNSPDDFEFVGEWDIDDFVEQVDETRPEDENDEWDVLDILRGIQHPDVDMVLFYQWHEDPMYQPWTIWGYKTDNAIEIDPQDAASWNSKGDALFDAGNYDEAIKAYDKALNLDPKLVDVWVIESAILGASGKYAECIQACDKAIELDPKNTLAWGNKGEALKDLGKYAEAIQALDTAIEFDPSDADVWHNKGEALKSLGCNTEAAAAFINATELGYTRCISDTFAEHFAHWRITLPQEDLNYRRSGHISQAGWLIQYCFGKDDTGEYMDYYATHRMTDDRHVRIYANGREGTLPALSSFYVTIEDPIKAKQLEDEYYRHNREVAKMLIDKGFDKFTINMFLQTGFDETNKNE